MKRTNQHHPLISSTRTTPTFQRGDFRLRTNPRQAQVADVLFSLNRNRRLAGVPFSRTSPLQPRNSRLDPETQCHTTIKVTRRLLVCPSLARPRTSVDSKTCVQTTADQDATLRSSANLPLVNSGKVTNRGAEVHTREASSTPPTTSFYTLAQWTTATRESPRHGDPSHKNQLLPYFQRSMTSATC